MPTPITAMTVLMISDQKANRKIFKKPFPRDFFGEKVTITIGIMNPDKNHQID